MHNRASQRRRAWWIKTLHQWHWISAALCLFGMLLFSATGITLNHAAQIGAEPQLTNRVGQLPAPLLKRLRAARSEGDRRIPDDLVEWFADELGVTVGGHEADWNDGELSISMPRPGVDAWLSVTLATGMVEFEKTDRGWISWLNDLHKGRNAGTAWSWFIDLLAVSCLLFAITGLFLLQVHSARRPMTWPMVGMGLLVPAVLTVLFAH